MIKATEAREAAAAAQPLVVKTGRKFVPPSAHSTTTSPTSTSPAIQRGNSNLSRTPSQKPIYGTPPNSARRTNSEDSANPL